MYSTKLLFAALIIIVTACQREDSTNKPLPENVQAISLVGDTLFTNLTQLPAKLESRIDSLIDVAEANNDDLATMMIWQARKKGYQGEYRAAIDYLSDAIASFPEDARLYRHRGHRYLTLRQLDLAIADFEKATTLIEGKEDIVEPDGLPNAQNKPTSTLQSNIWYHLGLAYYLKGDYKNAQNSYENCLKVSLNNDMKVATTYWYYMTLRKAGKDELAGKILATIPMELDLIENTSYHKLLLVFKGEFDSELLLAENSSALDNATLGYGLGFWHSINGRTERAHEIWQQVYDTNNWSPFGFIASEAELARMN